MDNLPKKEIVQKVLTHLNVKDEKVYDVDIYLQKIYYVFTESPFSEKGQEHMVDALVQAETETIYNILNQDEMDYQDLVTDPLKKYYNMDLK